MKNSRPGFVSLLAVLVTAATGLAVVPLGGGGSGGLVAVAWADEVYLSAEEAPRAVFREATRFEAATIPGDEAVRDKIRGAMGDQAPTAWESGYPVISAYRGDEKLGDAVVVEELGKHRNMTFVVGVGMDGTVTGVAMMVYREAYGGEVRSDRFLSQYRGKTGTEPLLPGRDIRNITGATLSANAIGRGVKKAVAVAVYARQSAAGAASSSPSH